MPEKMSARNDAHSNTSSTPVLPFRLFALQGFCLVLPSWGACDNQLYPSLREPFIGAHPVPMKMPRCPAVLLLILLFKLFIASDTMSAGTETAKDAPQATTAQAAPSSDQALGEIRSKREKAQQELDAVNQPKTLAAGAPPGTSQEELLERRTLLHHIVRSLDEQIDDSVRLEQARRRRGEGSDAASAPQSAEGESPPYSVFFADRLWDTAFSLRLTVEGLQSQLALIELRSGRAREALQASEERLRQAAERLESAHGTPSQD